MPADAAFEAIVSRQRKLMKMADMMGDHDKAAVGFDFDGEGSGSDSEDEGELYEVRDVGGIGVRVFAARDISAGTCIEIEDPIVVIPKQRSQLDPFTLQASIAALPQDKKTQWDRLRTSLDIPVRREETLKKNETYKPMVEEMYGDAGEVLPPTIMTDISKVDFNNAPLPNGTGIYDLVCRINHSCQPNADKRGVYDDSIGVYALQDIKAGEEITATYGNELLYMTHSERKEGLVSLKNFFDCECRLCTAPVEERILSDARRRLLHQLTVIAYGEVTVPSFMLDPKGLRNQLARQTANLSRHAVKTVVYYLIAALAEAEGITDRAHVEKAYCTTAMSLVQRCDERGLDRLNPSALRNSCAWVARSKEVVRLQDMTPEGEAAMEEKWEIGGLVDDDGNIAQECPCCGGHGENH